MSLVDKPLGPRVTSDRGAVIPPHDQEGVVSRRQLLDAGTSAADIRRLLRRRELHPVHPGVYVDHTGPPTWHQRAWAAVLSVWPAALAGESALVAHENGPFDQRRPVEVAVPHGRHVTPPEGVTVTRMRHFDENVEWHRRPPLVAYDAAVLDVAIARARPLDRIATLAKAVGTRRTTAERLRERLEDRPRVPIDAGSGASWPTSATAPTRPLEHGYLTNVERAHGLPAARRQVRHVGDDSVRYSDVEVRRVVIELDGRAFHGSAHQRDLDLDRDLESAVSARIALRLG